MGSCLFHSGTGALVSEPCGVWQNTQISSVPVLTCTAPVPLVLRLCLVFAMPAFAAPAASNAPSANAAAKPVRAMIALPPMDFTPSPWC